MPDMYDDGLNKDEDLIEAVIVLTKEQDNRLERLMTRVGIYEYAELINAAVSLLDMAISERRKGRVIASVDEQEMEYSVLYLEGVPALEYKGD